MHVIAKKTLLAFGEIHPDAQEPLLAWWKVAKHAEWANLNEVRQTYPHADPVAGLTVFNIGGNKFRLVVSIDYVRQKIYVKDVLTHEDHNKGSWKRS